jgi:S1-C subfamily serine protease
MSETQAPSPVPSSFSDPSAVFAAAVARVAPSVVRVPRRRGGGSGLVWRDDLVITSSFHGADEVELGVPTADGAIVERAATLVGRDPGTDLALYRVDGGGLTPAVTRALDGLAAGHLAFAVARPGRAIRASLRAVGVVGPEVRTPAGGRLERYVETDRALPRGFGGGPLIDLRGEVIGMNTRTLIGGTDLAVPVVTIERVVGALLAHGRVPRGYLGVGAYPAAAPGGGRGALVASLDDGGPAAAAGIGVGDLIVAIDGEAVRGPDDLRLVLADRAGATVEIALFRGGASLTITLTVGTRP